MSVPPVPPSAPSPADEVPPATPPSVAQADVRAVAEFQAFLREVTPRVRLVPFILIANVAVFGLMVARGVSFWAPTADAVLAWGANYGPRTLAGDWWRLLTNVFLHFGIIHLALNMLALWNAGPLVERLLGPVAFAAMYLVAGLTGSLASLAVHGTVVSAGASGAIFGVYGALAGFVLRQPGSVPKPALARLRNVALSFIIYNLIYGLGKSGIDVAAHVGGLVGGAAAGALLATPLAVGRPVEWRRATWVVLGCLALVAGTLRALPVPPDLQAVLRDFIAGESDAIDAYNGLVEQAKDHRLDDAGFATQIEQKVLPIWRRATARLAEPRAWSRSDRERVDELRDYGAARDKAWVDIASALRLHDDAGVKAGTQELKDAAAALRHGKSAE
jgi:rhomboid protease GluP